LRAGRITLTLGFFEIVYLSIDSIVGDRLKDFIIYPIK
jgi:hypothetical protein